MRFFVRTISLAGALLSGFRARALGLSVADVSRHFEEQSRAAAFVPRVALVALLAAVVLVAVRSSNPRRKLTGLAAVTGATIAVVAGQAMRIGPDVLCALGFGGVAAGGVIGWVLIRRIRTDSNG